MHGAYRSGAQAIATGEVHEGIANETGYAAEAGTIQMAPLVVLEDGPHRIVAQAVRLAHSAQRGKKPALRDR
ncbi:MAG: hypothetical protein IPL52_11175 [Flavobacteriales bacterium]|nr:hypothetical protein [Flavobacteriales bacterium]